MALTMRPRGGLSKGALDKSVSLLSRRINRRSFMGRGAMVASALVAAPATFALRPGTAYAAVCRCNGSCPCGSLCCDGYTEMCCTLTGNNRCPDGSVVAGWWKVDGSQFCGGQARFYMDCNAQCGRCGGSGGTCAGACSGTACGCANGQCDNRKAGCTRFRYGQCHQEIPLLGPIVCRVITCTPPWIVDPSCGTSSRTDNNTAGHDRPCLHEPFGGLDGVRVEGADIIASGWAIPGGSASATCDAVLSVDLADVARVASNGNRPDVAAIYPNAGAARGFGARFSAGYGRHLVCVRAIDNASGQQKFLAVTNVDIPAPTGLLEGASPLGNGAYRVTGWAYDTALVQNPANVIITLDGADVVQLAANLARPDIDAALPGAGPLHGFTVDLQGVPGPHQVCAVVAGNRGGRHPIGCIDVEVL